MTTSICAVSLLLLSAFPISATEPVNLPMAADHWTVEGNAEFARKDGFAALELKPRNTDLKLATGRALLNDFVFRDGTIEYDVQATGTMGAGFGFRRRDKDTYEEFYLRPRPKCDEAPDCVQYAPQTHGVLLWDLFPQYQSPAPLNESGWNHVKLVVSGHRMNVFINRAPSPALQIGNLEGDALEGGLMLEGPGIFANLSVTSGTVDGLPSTPEKDQTQNDQHYLRSWQMSPFSQLATDHEPSLADLPSAATSWTPLNAERAGLVNVSRELGLPLPRPGRALVWLKTNVTSSKNQTKKVQVGWNRELWVFVNGTQVFADKNLYQPPSARKTPDGRCSLDNGTFSLPLKKGKNEIVAAVANNFYGWAVIMRLADVKDLVLAHQ